MFAVVMPAVMKRLNVTVIHLQQVNMFYIRKKTPKSTITVNTQTFNVMDIQYPYLKLRQNFGAPCNFSDDGPRLIDDVLSNRFLGERYIYKSPFDRGTQESSMMSENWMNTPSTQTTDRGMNHAEGGWPKELDMTDEEAVLRFRKRVERDDVYVSVLKELTKPMEHAVKQNNAVNIYQQFFDITQSHQDTPNLSCQGKCSYVNPNEVETMVNHLSWSPGEVKHFAASYCDMEFTGAPPKYNTKACVWDIEYFNSPIVQFQAKTPIVCLEFNPKDTHCLISGLFTGQVAFWDARKGPEPVEACPVEIGHRDPCHSVLWIASKSGTEFFSTSSDGVVKWWDSRKLDAALNSIILDVTKEKPILARAHPPSCLEYDANVPTKYLVGTDDGRVICGNRKGANHAEQLPWIMKVHEGPVRSLQKNQVYNKYYLTVGDWQARIWSEECKESSVIWTKNHKVELTAGEWSPARYSVFFIIRADGIIDTWDLLQSHTRAVLTKNLCSEPLKSLRVHEDGELVLVGNESGKTFLLQYSEDLAVTTKNDKMFLSAMLERESRREKILEARNREIKVKFAAKTVKPTQSVEIREEEKDYVKLAEDEYLAEVQKQLIAYEERRKVYRKLGVEEESELFLDDR